MKRRRVLCLLALCACLCLCAVGARAAGYSTATINALDADRVHLRAEPSTEAQSLGLYFTGTSVRYESDPSQEWTKVTIGAESGYMMSRYLATSGEVGSGQIVGTVASDTDEVILRRTPSAQDESVGTVCSGEWMAVLGETASGWYYVRAGSRLGYAGAADVALNGHTVPGVSGPAAGMTVSEVYRQVLEGSRPLVYGGRPVFFDELRGPSDDRVAQQMMWFQLADLDADGAAEIVLAITGEYCYIVLDEQDGAVVGLDFVYRALLELKADGTFSYSSGAADNGFGNADFEDGIAEIVPIAESEMTVSGEVIYRVHGQEASEADYLCAVDAQAHKSNAVWFGLTANNIAMLL